MCFFEEKFSWYVHTINDEMAKQNKILEGKCVFSSNKETSFSSTIEFTSFFLPLLRLDPPVYRTLKKIPHLKLYQIIWLGCVYNYIYPALTTQILPSLTRTVSHSLIN